MDKVKKFMELKEQWKKASETERVEIDKEISRLASDEQRTALTMRYINRIPVAEIAEAMGYAEPTIYKLMNQGGEIIAKSIRNIK